MARGGFLALAAAGQGPEAAARALDLGRRLKAEGGWRRTAAPEGLRLWVREAAPLAVTALPYAGGVVIGDLFPMPGASPADSPLSDGVRDLRRPADLARRLSRAHWGRYVALLAASGGMSVFRDPSGDLNCLTWTRDGLQVVASDLELAPAWLQPRHMALNWDRIAAYLASPATASTASLLDGVEAVPPGALQNLGEGPSAPEWIWRPSAFTHAAPADLDEAARDLVARVDLATGALAGGYGGLLAEVSGGLDSAILAGALGHAGMAPKVRQWLNRVGERAEGDERAYARAVTDRLGVDLTAVVKPLELLEEADLAELASAFWPSINGVDARRDRDMVQRLRATGAAAIVSGEGGDAVFFQMPSPLVADEELRRRGLAALGSPVLADVARRTRQSVWQVIGAVRAARQRGGELPTAVSALVTPALRAWAVGLSHPWVAASSDASPAKRLQIQAIASAHIHRADCRRGREADLLFPLLAQPVVELCLSIPAPDLAAGALDRPFARRAFAGRVPELVRQRRSKGDLNAYEARRMAGSLPMLRPYLLEGCLCEAGLLDRGMLAAALDPQALIRAPASSDILCALAVEAWVRHWQGRAPDSAAAPRLRPALRA